MKIAYTKKQLTVSLVLGIVWLVLALLNMEYYGGNHWTAYGNLVISLLYLSMYGFQKKKTYLTIDNDLLKVNGLFGKKVYLKNIKQIKKFAGDYIIKTDKKELTINTQLIAPNSLESLNAKLEELDVEWS